MQKCQISATFLEVRMRADKMIFFLSGALSFNVDIFQIKDRVSSWLLRLGESHDTRNGRDLAITKLIWPPSIVVLWNSRNISEWYHRSILCTYPPSLHPGHEPRPWSIKGEFLMMVLAQ